MDTKKRLLFVGWSAVAFCLWWFVTSLVLAQEGSKQLGSDLSQAIQHIGTVKLISSEQNSTDATIRSIGQNLIGIKTNNFVISQTWDSKKNEILAGGNSNILWWVKNQISWSYSSILWWYKNINNGDYSTILWWSGNKIREWWSEYSTIFWAAKLPFDQTSVVFLANGSYHSHHQV